MKRHTIATVRAVGVVAVTAAVVTGVTLATYQSNTVNLTSAQLTSANAQLVIKSTGADYGTTDTGFDFTGLAPGTPSAPFTFYLDNTGGVDLTISASSGPLTPISNFDPTQVTLHFVNVTASGASQDYPLSQLATGLVLPGGPIIANSVDQYTVSATISSAAVTGSGGGVSPFTITLTGTN
ncbi:MAG: hypothetical protein ACHQUB_01985 [Candidatus Saccharimonadia bacterium]